MPEPKPVWTADGKLEVLMNDLVKNYLTVRRLGSKSAMQKWKRVKISPDLAEIITLRLSDPSKSQPVNSEIFKRLSENDDRLLCRYLNLVKMPATEYVQYEKMRVQKEGPDNDLKRFQLLRDELIAGNDNMDIVKEMRTILLKLQVKNLVPKDELTNLMYQLLLVLR
jgi:hypothetical protein